MPPENNSELEDEYDSPDLGGASSGIDDGAEQTPSPFLRDLSEDTVYERLQQAGQFPENLSAIENRFQGGLGSLTKRLDALEKGYPSQSSLDVEALTKGLQAYDPKLAEVLGPLLQDAFKTTALDENVLRPFLDERDQGIRKLLGEELVRAAYSPEALDDIIPEVVDGKFSPKGQRQKDFVDWFSKQGYNTQQSLLSFGSGYIHSMRAFEKWETKLNEDRAAKANGKTQQLVQGQQPSSRTRGTPRVAPLSDSDAFLAGFKEAADEG